jgi:hypothetical protein
MSSAINSKHLLELIHLGTAQLQKNPDPTLGRLIDTAVSILAFNLRKATFLARDEQAHAVKQLQLYIQSTNIHTSRKEHA